MATPTPNKGLERPARGDLSGVWDTPVNANMDIIDNSFGGVTTIPLLATNVTLSTSQAQCMMIRLTGAITTNIAIIFPAIGGIWTIVNDCTNQSSFYIYAYNGATANYIGIPPGVTDIMGDGTYMRYRSLPPIGSYMMLAGNVYQPWMQVGSPQLPYLNCDGSAISGVYTQLIQMIGGALPDLRGRCFFNTDQSTGRLTTYLGSVYTHAGGNQFPQIHSHGITAQLSGYSIDNINHAHGYLGPADQQNNSSFGGSSGIIRFNQGRTSDANPGDINAHRHYLYGGTDNALSGGSGNIPPAIIGGLTFIRAGA